MSKLSAMSPAQLKLFFDRLDETPTQRGCRGSFTMTDKKKGGEFRTRAQTRKPPSRFRLREARKIALDELAVRAQQQDQELRELGLLR
jgi:hypothetical protein